MTPRFLDASGVAALVPDGATVLVDGSGGGVNEPAAILGAIERRFLDEGHPRDLTVLHISGMGDGHGGGIDHFAHRGMVRRVIGGHWSWATAMQRMAVDEEIEAYCLPQGTLSHLLREIAGGRPGVVSPVGLGTCVDPRLGGGRLNERTTEDIVELIDIHGRQYLFTPSLPIDVAIVRGTLADTHGNIVMDGEGLAAEVLSAAQAARNSGGIVLAQVRSVVAHGALDPRRVRIPGVLVDAVCADPGQRLSVATADDPFLTGAYRAPTANPTVMPLTERKVIARRAAAELRVKDVINLGFGMPDGVAAVLSEEGVAGEVTFTVEQGHIGGVPAGGSDFGMCINPDASVDAGYQFDWYDGGGLDIAVLSFAQIDPAGNVNVSKFGGRIAGVGGFINISQGAKRLVFVGTFVAARGYRVGGRSIDLPPGGTAKFVETVEQISFSAEQALAAGKPVSYVTERAVFELHPDGIVLTEIAPGLDLESDVLAHMEFRPKISDNLAQMDPRYFADEPLSLVLKATKGAATRG